LSAFQLDTTAKPRRRLSATPERIAQDKIKVVQIFSIGEMAMTPKFRRPIVLAAFVAMGLLDTSAHADLTIAVQENAGPVQFYTVTGSPASDLLLGSGLGTPTMPPSGIITTADYTIKVLGGEADQNSTSQLLSSTTSITYTGTSSSSPTNFLTITITGTLYTSPTAPPNVSASSQIGGSVTQGSSGDTLAFTSSVIPATFVSPFTPQTPSITKSNSSYNDTQTQTITSLPTPYTIVETLVIGLDTLNDKIGYQSSTTLTSIAPEPSTLVLAGLGGLGVVGYGLRRRKALSV
jgi:PEP-CTERM motif